MPNLARGKEWNQGCQFCIDLARFGLISSDYCHTLLQCNNFPILPSMKLLCLVSHFSCRRGLLFYFLQLFLLTFALASAARSDLPLNGGYRDPIDIFRFICEAAILLIAVVQIGIEVFEFL